MVPRPIGSSSSASVILELLYKWVGPVRADPRRPRRDPADRGPRCASDGLGRHTGPGHGGPALPDRRRPAHPRGRCHRNRVVTSAAGRRGPVGDAGTKGCASPATQSRNGTMRVYSAEETRNMLPFGALIEALREMFRAGAAAPLRHHHAIPLGRAAGRDPALDARVDPGWPGRGQDRERQSREMRPSECPRCPRPIFSSMRAPGGTSRCWTAAKSPTGGPPPSRRWRRATWPAPDARRLLVVGAGRVAGNLADAFRAVRPIEDVAVWDIDAGDGRRVGA